MADEVIADPAVDEDPIVLEPTDELAKLHLLLGEALDEAVKQARELGDKFRYVEAELLRRVGAGGALLSEEYIIEKRAGAKKLVKRDDVFKELIYIPLLPTSEVHECVREVQKIELKTDATKLKALAKKYSTDPRVGPKLADILSRALDYQESPATLYVAYRPKETT